MPLTDTRVIPLLSARIWDKGAGEAFVSTQAFGWYDILAHSWPTGTISKKASSHELTLEFVENIGLCCRPYLTQKDTRSSQFTTTGGLWEERKPFSGEQKYWLVQYSSAADTVWSAKSTYTLPADPHIAVQIAIEETPSTQDTATYPPYVRLEFGIDTAGNPQWGIRLDQTGGCFLQAYVSGQWEDVQDLGNPQPIRQLGGDRYMFLLRPMRNTICVSHDFGKSYQQFRYRTGAAATIRAGKWQVSGQGHVCGFNLSQLLYYTGAYTSPTRNAQASRILPTPTITARRDIPGSSSVSLADLSVPGNGVAQYKATLTPSSSGSTPFPVYTTPTLYAVQFTYPPVLSYGFGSSTILSDCEEWAIDKPFELDGATMMLTFRKDAGTQFTWDYGRWPRVDVQAGWLNDDGTTANYTVFTGYLRMPQPRQNEYGKARYTLTVDNASIRFKERTWDEFSSVPLGGQTVNAALDAILVSEGLNATFRRWWITGDFVVLPAGLAEDPFEWPPPGESKWETMTRIAQHAGLELGVLDDGTYVTVPRDYTDQYLSRIWEGNPASDATAAVMEMRVSVDSAEQATAVLVRGTDEFGNSIYGFAVDTLAEQYPGSPHFSPWRRLIREELPGTATVGMCISRAQGIAVEHFRIKVESEVTVPLDLSIGRRMAAQVQGTNLGIVDADINFVLTVRHVGKPAIAECVSTYGLRRRNAT